MGLLGRALAGGMAGAGEGLSSVGEKRYESAMEEVRALRDANLKRLQADYVFDQRKELAETERGWQQQDNKAALKQQRKLAEQEAKRRAGEVSRYMETDRGIVGLTRGGEAIETGYRSPKTESGQTPQSVPRLDKNDYEILDNTLAQHLVEYLPDEAKVNLPPGEAPSLGVIMQYLPEDVRKQALAARQDAEYLVRDGNRGYGNAVSVALKNRLQGQPASPSPKTVPAPKEIVAELRSVAPEDMPRKAAEINNRYQSLEVQRLLEEELDKIREAPESEKGSPSPTSRKSAAYRKWAENPPEPVRHEAGFNLFGGLLGEDPEYQRRVEEAKRRSEENKKRFNMQ